MISTLSFGQIKVVNNKVGIGEFWEQNPNWNLDVNGEMWISCYPATSGVSFVSTELNGYNCPTLLPQWGSTFRIGTSEARLAQVFTTYLHYVAMTQISDQKVKQNIRPMSPSLDKINNLSLVNFDYTDEFIFKNADSSNVFKKELCFMQKDNNGFLAQDVEKIFPRLVLNNEESGLKEVNYIGFIPELTKAIQELSAEIDKLKIENEYLKLNCCQPESTTNTLNDDKAKLYQNVPNPFNADTKISYYIPVLVKQADIYIYNLNGTQIKHISVFQKGQGSYTLTANDLEAGMYIYTLIVDDNVIDSKKMILTK
jgi:hypothetical protein